MSRELRWYNDDSWWWANSAVHDDGDHFIYRVAKTEQGWYAHASDSELCMPWTYFPTKRAAFDACQRNETAMVKSLTEESKP